MQQAETLVPDLGILDHVPRVLIVDDEQMNRSLLQVTLAADGYDLLFATTGEAALKIVADDSPDLMLLDLNMPGIGGQEVVERVKRDPATARIPVIMVTSSDDRESRMRAWAAGAEDFLTKPVDRAELRVRVRNLLRTKGYSDFHAKHNASLVTALRSSEDRAAFALAAAGMGIWEVDFKGETVDWSDTMAPLCGLPAGTQPGGLREAIEMVHADDRDMVVAAIAAAATDGERFSVEFRVVWPDNAIHWLASAGHVRHDDEGNPSRLLGIATDISERNQLESQFRQSQKMEAVGQLAGGVAHDFNNLLTVILAYSEFVLEGLPAGDALRNDVDEIRTAGRRAATLTHQLLTFSRKQILKPTQCDLNTLVAGMLAMLSRLIGADVELVTAPASDLGMVRADCAQIEQVLMNLVVNARDAMPSGGRVVIQTANVDLDGSFWKVEKPGRYVMLSVSDNGAGMDVATKERLFEPFFTTKAAGKGTGLGLATVYGIVKQSGGHVWVDSEPGQGATFKVYLPRTEDEVEQPSLEAPVAPESSGGETLLLIEDELAVRQVMKRILEHAGYTVVAADNAGHAEKLFTARPAGFDLVVTDIVMPGSSGPALYKKLARMRADLRVVFVSGYADDAMVAQGLLAEGIDVLEKPFTGRALTERVRETLDRSMA